MVRDCGYRNLLLLSFVNNSAIAEKRNPILICKKVNMWWKTQVNKTWTGCPQQLKKSGASTIPTLIHGLPAVLLTVVPTTQIRKSTAAPAAVCFICAVSGTRDSNAPSVSA